METNDKDRQASALDGQDAPRGGTPSSGKNLTAQQRLMKHPILICILFPAIYIIIAKVFIICASPVLGASVTDTIVSAFELVFFAVILIWMKRGTGMTFGYTFKRFWKAALFLLPMFLLLCLMNLSSTPALMSQSSLPMLGVVLLGLFQGAAPGFFEETVIRGLGVTSMMDVWHDRTKVILMSACISAAIFGILHASNFIKGDFLGTTGQILYAAGLGIMFAGAYLRTHNLLACSIVHALIDASADNNSIIRNSLGISSPMTSLSSLLIMAVIALIMAAVGLFLIRRKKQDEIRALWYPA
jgi:hypothetical protein